MTLFDKKYQIFISSTYTDLISAREAIMKSILDMYHIPIGMEMFSADNDDQWDTIKHTIDNSDYYVLIVGFRYGSIDKDGVGYTEKEFNYAKEIGIPILSFVRNENVATKPEERENDANKVLALATFKEKVKSNSIIEFWQSDSDLALKVTNALGKIFRKTPRLGWVRGDKAISSEVTNEMATLVKENRELKHELTKYRNNSNFEPKFELYFSDGNRELELDFKDQVGKRSDYIEIEDEDNSEIVIYESMGKYQTFSHRDTINEYNKKIRENINDVIEYNSKLERQKRISQANYKINLKVKNAGNKKANDVFVKVCFPKEILVFDRLPTEEIVKYPESIPPNPYTGQYKQLAGLLPSIIFPKKLNLNDLSVKSISVDDFCVTDNFKSILHTTEKEMDDFYIVPLSRGTFTINASIICEEFTESNNFEIKIVVK